jgi:hypothetical protein
MTAVETPSSGLKLFDGSLEFAMKKKPLTENCGPRGQ